MIGFWLRQMAEEREAFRQSQKISGRATRKYMKTLRRRHMKVRELIAKLSAEPQDYEVVLGDDYRTYRVVGMNDTSTASEEVSIEIQRTGGKEE